MLECATLKRPNRSRGSRMKRAVDHSAMIIAGYTTPWSVASGQSVSLHLSCGEPVRTVNVRRLDLPSPRSVDWPMQVDSASCAHRDFNQGSFLRISANEVRKAGCLKGISFELLLTQNESPRTILKHGPLSLLLRNGMAVLEIGSIELELLPATNHTWLTVTVENDDECLAVEFRGHDALCPIQFRRRIDAASWKNLSQDILFGSDGEDKCSTLNARFAAIKLLTEDGEVNWTFPTLLPRGNILDINQMLVLEVLNNPTFCVTSLRWDGSGFDPRIAPTHYDAIHCHDDDMGPLDWPASVIMEVPDAAEPGVYAFEVKCDSGKEEVVFFVSTREARAPLLFVIPTATYLAYADEFLPPHLYEWLCEDRGQRFAVDNNLRSLYDYHSDHSGVSLCSYRKPKATLRADYRYPLCGCPHNLPVDLHFLRFCHDNGIAIDIMTDHDLHERGPQSLKRYKAVVTGSHPEYVSMEMEGALREFLSSGGSLAYLGGNGFAGTVAFQDDLMELRRSPLEAGRTWDGPVSEQALSITNEPGGHLRNRGRGEFSLVGGAISLMGFSGARPFSRTPASHAPENAWLFEGVASETFGDSGMVLGGAAGYEVDATDPHLGTSPDVVVVARATEFPDDFFHDPTRWYQGGEDEQRTRRCAEMTIRRLAAGGLIFSASSVAWCGALPETGKMNDVGVITRNLLDRLSMDRS